MVRRRWSHHLSLVVNSLPFHAAAPRLPQSLSIRLSSSPSLANSSSAICSCQLWFSRTFPVSFYDIWSELVLPASLSFFRSLMSSDCTDFVAVLIRDTWSHSRGPLLKHLIIDQVTPTHRHKAASLTDKGGGRGVKSSFVSAAVLLFNPAAVRCSADINGNRTESQVVHINSSLFFIFIKTTLYCPKPERFQCL